MDIKAETTMSDPDASSNETLSEAPSTPPKIWYTQDIKDCLESLKVSIKTYIETYKPDTVDAKKLAQQLLDDNWGNFRLLCGAKEDVIDKELLRGAEAGHDTKERERVGEDWKRLEESGILEIGQDNWERLVELARICEGAAEEEKVEKDRRKVEKMEKKMGYVEVKEEEDDERG